MQLSQEVRPLLPGRLYQFMLTTTVYSSSSSRAGAHIHLQHSHLRHLTRIQAPQEFYLSCVRGYRLPKRLAGPSPATWQRTSNSTSTMRQNPPGDLPGSERPARQKRLRPQPSCLSRCVSGPSVHCCLLQTECLGRSRVENWCRLSKCLPLSGSGLGHKVQGPKCLRAHSRLQNHGSCASAFHQGTVQASGHWVLTPVTWPPTCLVSQLHSWHLPDANETRIGATAAGQCVLSRCCMQLGHGPRM